MSDGAAKGTIRPFRIDVPQEDLDDLRRRITAMRWPEKQTVDDESQGVRLETMRALADYWATEYDWRPVEARLQAFPQFVTEIDGVDIHFIQVRSQHDDALPIIVTHGWPGSIIEQLKIIGPLTDPEAHGATRGGRLRRGDPVAPGPRILGHADHDRLGSDPHRASLDHPDGAAGLRAIRRPGRRLGERRHRADGAAAADGIARHPYEHAGDDPGRHREGPRSSGDPPPRDLSDDERYAWDQLDFFYKHGLAYAQEMGNRPQTLYALEDSPVGLAAWMLDHDARSLSLIARVFDGQAEGLTKDDILDNATLYWLTRTAVSSARLYWESKLAFFAPKGVDLPVGVSVFPDEIYAAPRSWAESAYPKLIHYNRLPKGGHFAAWEQPQMFSEELRAAFRSLR